MTLNPHLTAWINDPGFRPILSDPEPGQDFATRSRAIVAAAVAKGIIIAPPEHSNPAQAILEPKGRHARGRSQSLVIHNLTPSAIPIFSVCKPPDRDSEPV